MPNVPPIAEIKDSLAVQIQSFKNDERDQAIRQIIALAPAQHGEAGIIHTEMTADSQLIIRARESKLPASDPLGKQTAIGFGCAIGYAVELAAAMGTKYEWNFIEDDGTFDHQLLAVSGKFVPNGNVDLKKINLLLNRRTIRGVHKPGVNIEKLKTIPLPTGSILITEKQEILKMSQFAFKGFMAKFQEPNFLLEMFHSLVASDEMATAKTGMHPSEFFMQGRPMPLMPRFMFNLMAKLATSRWSGKMLQNMLAEGQRDEVASTNAYLVMVANRNTAHTDLKDYAKHGVEFMSYWFKVFSAGYALQPTQVFSEAPVSNEALVNMLHLSDKEEVAIAARIGFPAAAHTPPMPPKAIVA